MNFNHSRCMDEQLTVLNPSSALDEVTVSNLLDLHLLLCAWIHSQRGWLVDWCLTALSAQTGNIMPQENKIYYVGLGYKANTIKQWNNTLNEKVTNTHQPRLCRDNPLATTRLPQRSLSSQSLGKYWQPEQPKDRTHTVPTQILKWHKKKP